MTTVKILPDWHPEFKRPENADEREQLITAIWYCAHIDSGGSGERCPAGILWYRNVIEVGGGSFAKMTTRYMRHVLRQPESFYPPDDVAWNRL
jgi:hypothetical protein